MEIGLFFGVFALGIYLSLHFFSHGPLLIYPEQWQPDFTAYKWDDSRPSMPGSFAFGPAFFTFLYLTPLLLLPSIDENNTKAVFLFLSSFIIAKTLFAIINNRESIKFDGFTVNGVLEYAKEWITETIKDFWLRGIFKIILLVAAWVLTLIPLLNYPLPFLIEVSQVANQSDLTGIPVLLFIIIGLVFSARWHTYYYTLTKARSAGYATRKHLFIHFCTLPAFIILIYYINTVYAYGGFVLGDFDSSIPVIIGGLIGFITE